MFTKASFNDVDKYDCLGVRTVCVSCLKLPSCSESNSIVVMYCMHVALAQCFPNFILFKHGFIVNRPVNLTYQNREFILFLLNECSSWHSLDPSKDVCLLSGNRTKAQITQKGVNESPLWVRKIDLTGSSRMCHPGCYSHIFVHWSWWHFTHFLCWRDSAYKSKVYFQLCQKINA